MKKVLVLGAGQLAKMMALAGSPLNMDVRAFDVRSDRVVDPITPTHIYGNLSQGINHAEVITAEFEHVAHHTLAICEASDKLLPSSQAIKIGGDRRLEKSLLEQCQVANATHHIIQTQDDFNTAIEQLSLPIIFKSALDGYDGKGQWRMKSMAQAEDIWAEMSDFMANAKSSVPQGIVAEKMVPFDREVSLVGVRNTYGEVAVYPLTENHHTSGVLSVSIAAPVEEKLQAQAKQVFTKLSEKLNYVGVLAIEFFQVGEQLLVNEIAPRVHNSGHWTQQGADTCQFENHLRGISGLPLGSTQLIRPTAMVNILGQDAIPNVALAIPSLTVHWYGKEQRAGRKMGHINVSGRDQQQLAQRLCKLAEILDNIAFPELASFSKGYLASVSG